MMKYLLGFCLVLVLSVIALQVIPVGTKRIRLECPECSEPVYLVRPRYNVPREIFFTGWPLAGGNFGLAGDPHLSGSIANHVRIMLPVGEYGEISVQGIDINQAFESLELKEQVLAVTHNDVLREYILQDLDGQTIAWINNVFVLGIAQNGDELLLLLSLRNSRFLVSVMWPLDNSPAQLILERNSEQWDDAIARVSQVVGLEEQSEQFCGSRIWPVINFWTETLMKPCD